MANFCAALQGPLDDYRRLSSFECEKMKLILEDKEIVEYKKKCWDILEKDSLFSKVHGASSFDELRKLTALRSKKLRTLNLLPWDELSESPDKLKALYEICFSFDGSASIKFSLSWSFVPITLMGIGTSKHLSLAENLRDPEGDIVASFLMTEISHGTNTKAIRTTATFDPASQQFILNTPDFEASKCWAANLGKTATHSIVFSNLILPSGEDCGLHTFIVPIRDPKTLISYPGVKIGDLGPKIGLNGIDNGFIAFDHYPVTKDSLLNKNGDVTPEGKYVSPIKDIKKRFGASLGALSAGRVGIITLCYVYLAKALTISIRYSAVRKQFGPTQAKEIPIIEYPLQQWRLFRYLAGLYALKIFTRVFNSFLMKCILNSYMGNPILLQESGSEIHALSCATKPVAGWLARDGIQESREACGGHGYLKCAGIGDLRDDNDANLTYEGDNNVLLQQTSHWLLSLWARKDDPTVWDTPLRTAAFLKNYKPSEKTVSTFKGIEEVLTAYEWLIWYHLDKTAKLQQDLKSKGFCDFNIKNNSHVYAGKELSIAYAEYNILRMCWEFMLNVESEEKEKTVLKRLLFLHSLYSLEKHLVFLYEGGFLRDRQSADNLRSSIVKVCKEIKNDAVNLIDAVAPPDFCLNSPLGSSDGRFYSRLESTLLQTPGTFGRPSWWKELVSKI